MTDTRRSFVLRVTRDLREFYGEKSEEMFAFADDNDVTRVHAVIRGPKDTPYEKGFFYFVFTFPTDYPLRPPKVTFMTTDANRVRFNPNLYACGKVCLSILGTWSGPEWTPCQTLFSTLLSIQSIMNEKPYRNEPGFESYDNQSEIDKYNAFIAHETLRVAVIGMLWTPTADATNIPLILRDVMIASFKQNYRYFEDTIKSRLEMDGQTVSDPFGDYSQPSFQYKELLHRLRTLKEKYEISDELRVVSIRDDPLAKEYFEILSKTVTQSMKRELKPVCDEVLDFEDFDESESLSEYEEESESEENEITL
ncbi:unnamed protein product [Medioppia subpectinata]|uniref:Ubiquitin-conjugating enzyme E2 Z n=1 Tax=Medioppia subpectinata TaxID=1979941 RepID=A0A7R9Q3Y9_9ACAR|nr:unnamed protein product [Medioppia subpectinata]CAG2111814.1 unnamed protein product [Medioppia subpectinata]